MDNSAIQTYFNAERSESILFIAAGLLAIGVGLYCWFVQKTPLARGLACSLVIVALIHISVGAGIFIRSPKDIVRVEQIVKTERSRIQSEEIPRMNAVMKNFDYYRYLEISLVALGLALVLFGAKASLWQGVGVGLIVQAGLTLLLDLFAEQRGEIYIAYLKSLA